MPPRMPCHLSDDPRDPDDAIPGLDDLETEDDAYERTRQADIDDGDSLHNTLQDIARSAVMECPKCSEIPLEAQRIDTTPDGRLDFMMYECGECGIETAFTGEAA